MRNVIGSDLGPKIHANWFFSNIIVATCPKHKRCKISWEHTLKLESSLLFQSYL